MKKANGGGRVPVRDFGQALLSSSLTTTVTGTFVDLTGAPVTSGQVRFELKPSIATVIQGQNMLEPSVVYGSISSTGQLLNQAGTGPCVVVQNTVLEPGGTYYEVSIWPEFIKTAVYSWFATQATQDISASIPLPPVLPFVPTVTVGLARVVMITATGTYNPTPGVTGLYVECVGGGGAGGGAPVASSNLTAGSGGGAGGYSASWLLGALVKTSYNVGVGAGGVGAAGANGGNGGDTNFDVPSSCTARGGSGGTILPAGTAAQVGTSVSGGGISNGGVPGVGDFTSSGGNGSQVIRLSGTAGVGGTGGSSIFSGNQPGSALAGNGSSGIGYGGGGGGALNTLTSPAFAGGNGAPGVIRVWEFN